MPRPSAIERLLKGPPPQPKPGYVTFDLVLTTNSPPPPWPTKTHKRHGCRVHYRGEASHQWGHNYELFPQRALETKWGADLLGMYNELYTLVSNDLDVMQHSLGECGFCPLLRLVMCGIHWPRTPDGLCAYCWADGRRAAGRLAFYRGRMQGERVIEVCENHVGRDYEWLDAEMVK